jgi:hypothetical protein
MLTIPPNYYIYINYFLFNKDQLWDFLISYGMNL